jgi:hypothetical protein
MRPSFKTILKALNNIVHSEFIQTPHESFHIMQDGWRVEIEQVLHELRVKEKVSFSKQLKCSACLKRPGAYFFVCKAADEKLKDKTLLIGMPFLKSGQISAGARVTLRGAKFKILNENPLLVTQHVK